MTLLLSRTDECAGLSVRREYVLKVKSPYRFYVYQWRNLTNGKLYVGKGTGGRHDRHRWRNDSHTGGLLFRAFQKHGRDSFQLVILEDGLTSEEACAREQHYIASRRTRAPLGYNLTDGGDGPHGVVHSPEAIAKMSAAKMGKLKSAETRARMSAATTGKKKSAAHCEAIRAGKTGLKYGAEWSAAISKGLMGHIHSNETRAKIGAANKGKTKGRPKSPEHREKLAAHLRAMHARRKALAAIPPGTQLALI